MFDDLSTPADIESICFRGVGESLNLEFKLKEDSSTPVPSKNDKRAIAEAISSFANSEGGTLVLGIATRNQGGADVASDSVPIAEVQNFRSAVDLICHTNVSPQIPNLRTKALTLPNGTGYVVCDVPRSDRRPHMSTAPGVHSYYRRDFHGSGLMTPSEIRDQILAVRDAILEPIVPPPAGGAFSMARDWVSARITIVFSLRNVGQALCRNPFLRVKSSCKLHSHNATFDSALGAWKTVFPYGTLIHVEDQERCLSLAFHACVRFDVLRALFKTEAHDLTESVLIFPGGENYHVTTISDKVSLDSIDFELRFGAENAPANTREISLSRAQLAGSILSQSTIADMYTQNVGPFRIDLVKQFASSTVG